MKIDYNIVVCISNVENAYEINTLNNFLFLLRSCVPYLPPYLKFVFTVQRDVERICQIMGTKNIYEVKDNASKQFKKHRHYDMTPKQLDDAVTESDLD